MTVLSTFLASKFKEENHESFFYYMDLNVFKIIYGFVRDDLYDKWFREGEKDPIILSIIKPELSANIWSLVVDIVTTNPKGECKDVRFVCDAKMPNVFYEFLLIHRMRCFVYFPPDVINHELLKKFIDQAESLNFVFSCHYEAMMFFSILKKYPIMMRYAMEHYPIIMESALSQQEIPGLLTIERYMESQKIIKKRKSHIKLTR